MTIQGPLPSPHFIMPEPREKRIEMNAAMREEMSRVHGNRRRFADDACNGRTLAFARSRSCAPVPRSGWQRARMAMRAVAGRSVRKSASSAGFRAVWDSERAAFADKKN